MPNNLDMGGFSEAGSPLFVKRVGTQLAAVQNNGNNVFTVAIDGSVALGRASGDGAASSIRLNTNDASYTGYIGKIANCQIGLDSTPASFGGFGVSTGNGFNVCWRNSGLAWDSSTGLGDVFLRRDAANTLNQRNGTTAQTFRVTRSYTDASNFSWLTHKWNTTTAVIHAEGLGTGSDGSVAFNDAALATSATVGFLMIPSCAGTPSGVPADIPTGQIPLVWDSTNLKLYAYTGGAWKASAAFT